MKENNIQTQIDQINQKLDMILEETALQKQNRETMVDLVDDLSIVGKDAFKGMVDTLENAGIEVDGEEINHLLLNFLRNINNINMLFRTMENINDLIKDFSPIIKQVGIDATGKFNELDRKGYFEILHQVTIALDTIMSRYSKEDLENLSDNLIMVMDALIAISDPAVMSKLSIFVKTYKEIDHESFPEYSIWKLMRELNKPDMKKSIGFIMTFLKKINSIEQNSEQLNN
ncbi:MAG: DUF1641 domain-containing protein [Bacteroidota bacterium]|nr:DUF1641 domain-containing protein [Bacteroidota bacterium]